MSMLGAVGPPVPNVDVFLESVPEMGYDALVSLPRGEVCIRGDTLLSGYYKRDDLAKEVFEDGWFHTGDVGEWQPTGSLKIIDRKKNIFKLSQGEYVAVENLENVYGLVPVIDIVRDGLLPSILAKVHPTQHTPIHSQICVGIVAMLLAGLFNEHMLSHILSVGSFV